MMSREGPSLGSTRDLPAKSRFRALERHRFMLENKICKGEKGSRPLSVPSGKKTTKPGKSVHSSAASGPSVGASKVFMYFCTKLCLLVSDDPVGLAGLAGACLGFFLPPDKWSERPCSSLGGGVPATRREPQLAVRACYYTLTSDVAYRIACMD